jgi:ParB family chromosome partitioning protein
MGKALSKKALAAVTTSPVTLDWAVLDIPLNKLRLSPRNVRKTAPTGIDELADNIFQVRVLQNLVVTQQADGMYEVEAGSRRLAALSLLLAQGRISEDYPVPCRVIPAIHASTASLTENAMREQMHPADEYLAFQLLVDEGKPVEDIAAIFGVTPAVVRRRLKLANVSPRLMDAFRDGDATLEQLMAMTLTDNHEVQDSLFFNTEGWQRQPYHLRQALTVRDIRLSEPVARFVGTEAYESAGGPIKRDLFAEGGEGVYLVDNGLLEKLAIDKLSEIARAYTDQGWGWVKTIPRFTPADLNTYAHEFGEDREPTEEETARMECIENRLQEIEDQRYDPDTPELTDAEDEALEAESERLGDELAILRDSLTDYAPERKQSSGVVLSISDAGLVRPYFGLVQDIQQQDDDQAEAGLEQAHQPHTSGGSPASATPKPKAALSEKLAMRLTAHKTAAMQATMARQPQVALAMVVYRMVRRMIKDNSYGNNLPLGINLAVPNQMWTAAPEIKTSPALLALEAQGDTWADQLDDNPNNLLEQLVAMPQEQLVELLAICCAQTIDAVFGHDRGSSEAHALARVIGLDMHEWWTPTAESYFNHISKASILEAVGQFAPDTVAKLSSLKKGELAAEAEKLAAGTGWLPPVMLTPEAAPELEVEAEGA